MQTAGGAGDRISLELLEHDGLMTPVLISKFGPLFALQISGVQSDQSFLRQSAIFQRSSGEKILDGSLEISLAALPVGFLSRLTAGDVLFGQLLQDFSIAVSISDRSIYRIEQSGDQDVRLGRRLSMHRLDSGAFLCRVNELLVPNRVLQRHRLA